jgi:DNA-binding response OmpR family regulator
VRHRILLAGFDPRTRRFIRSSLERGGFSIEEAATKAHATEKIRRNAPDLLVLSLVPRARPGVELYRRLRSRPETADLPILAISAKGAEADSVLALETGSEDFLVQPFSSAELVARVRALLRRREADSGRNSANLYQRGRLKIDFDRREVFVEGARCELTPREFGILRFLVLYPGRTYSRAELLDSVWGPRIVVKPRTVDVHIRHLRQQIERDDSKPRLILNVRKLGYRFNPEALEDR